MRCHLPDADVETLRNGPTAACVNGIARTVPRSPNGVTAWFRERIPRAAAKRARSCLIFGPKKCMLTRHSVQLMSKNDLLSKFPAGDFLHCTVRLTADRAEKPVFPGFS